MGIGKIKEWATLRIILQTSFKSFYGTDNFVLCASTRQIEKIWEEIVKCLYNYDIQ